MKPVWCGSPPGLPVLHAASLSCPQSGSRFREMKSCMFSKLSCYSRVHVPPFRPSRHGRVCRYGVFVDTYGGRGRPGLRPRLDPSRDWLAGSWGVSGGDQSVGQVPPSGLHLPSGLWAVCPLGHQAASGLEVPPDARSHLPPVLGAGDHPAALSETSVCLCTWVTCRSSDRGAQRPTQDCALSPPDVAVSPPLLAACWRGHSRCQKRGGPGSRLYTQSRITFPYPTAPPCPSSGGPAPRQGPPRSSEKPEALTVVQTRQLEEQKCSLGFNVQ